MKMSEQSFFELCQKIKNERYALKKDDVTNVTKLFSNLFIDYKMLLENMNPQIEEAVLTFDNNLRLFARFDQQHNYYISREIPKDDYIDDHDLW
jgi:RNA binding exosome subunit